MSGQVSSGRHLRGAKSPHPTSQVNTGKARMPLRINIGSETFMSIFHECHHQFIILEIDVNIFLMPPQPAGQWILDSAHAKIHGVTNSAS
jgi:hypothetical protein